ncbi:hypothetical protein NIES2101_10005 [Calothrix sp. HK-06]|nr:hypothetical protein NIES2101_10005 [Calothrix sp. HK-06]
MILQKLGKGYVEVKQDSELLVESTEQEIAELENAEAIAPSVKSLDKLEITRVFNLNPQDLRFCTWRPRNPLPRPEIKAFNQEEAIKHLYGIKHPNQDWLDWDKADVPVFMSHEEANMATW